MKLRFPQGFKPGQPHAKVEFIINQDEARRKCTVDAATSLRKARTSKAEASIICDAYFSLIMYPVKPDVDLELPKMVVSSDILHHVGQVVLSRRKTDAALRLQVMQYSLCICDNLTRLDFGDSPQSIAVIGAYVRSQPRILQTVSQFLHTEGIHLGHTMMYNNVESSFVEFLAHAYERNPSAALLNTSIEPQTIEIIFDVLFRPVGDKTDHRFNPKTRDYINQTALQVLGLSAGHISLASKDPLARYKIHNVAKVTSGLCHTSSNRAGLDALLLHLHAFPTIWKCEAFIKYGLYDSVVEQVWAPLREPTTQEDALVPGSSRRACATFGMLLSSLEKGLAMECATRILIHIMGQQDLIMLLARTTLSSVSEEEEDDLSGLSEAVGRLLAPGASSDFAEEHSIIPWLHCFKNIMSFQRCYMPLEHDSPREGPVAQWVEVGEKLGVDSSATETYANPELSDGCDWYKCPLYGEDLRCYPEVSLMRCLGCLQTKYCSIACQRGHWKADHKLDCVRKREESESGEID